MNDFEKCVAKMRKYQKDWTILKRPADLKESLKYERIIDNHLIQADRETKEDPKKFESLESIVHRHLDKERNKFNSTMNKLYG
jgi:hypothetical protein